MNLGDLCKEAKDKAAGKKAFDLLKAFGKNQKIPNASKLAQDISKAQSRFTEAFIKADTVGPCPFPGDEGDVEPVVDECVSDVINLISSGSTLCGNGALDGDEQCDLSDLGGATCESLGFNFDGTLGCTAACQYDVSGCECQAFPATGQTTAYQADKNDGIGGAVAVPDDGTVEAGATLAHVDNGDGTITDLNTGLMWEKKDDNNVAGIHDRDNYYAWSGNGSQETIWDWLDDVNAEGGTGFAGHSDWRIPDIKELQSIVNYEVAYPGPTVSSAFNTGCAPGCTVTTCSCTRNYVYWSSTTGASGPNDAWVVYFGYGGVGFDGRSGGYYVRAVRGGL